MAAPPPRYDQPMLNNLAAQRVSGTKLADYDMIVAVSQASVNEQMAYLHTLDKELQAIHVDLNDAENDNDEWTRLDAELEAPQIKLLVGPNKQRVMFHLRFKTGKMRYYKGTGKNAKDETMDIKDWLLAFEVNLTLQRLMPNQVPKDVQTVVRNLGEFAAHQILLDFANVNIATYSPSESKLGFGRNDADAGSAFNSVMAKYIAKLGNPDFKRPDGTVGAHAGLSCVAKANRKGAFERSPTITPTNFNFQALPFTISPGDNGVEGIEAGKANMLVYLQVTNEDATLPRSLLPVSANWLLPKLDPAARKIDGTIALSRGIFLESWLLPKLESINAKSTYVVDVAEWKSENLGLTTTHKLGGHLGLRGDDLSRAPFSKGPGWVPMASTDPAKRKYSYSTYDVKDDNEGLWRVWMKGWTKNEVTIPAGLDQNGKAVIEIKGQTTVEAYVHIDGIGEVGKSTGKVIGDWKMNLILDGAGGGAIKFRFDLPELRPVMTRTIDETALHPGIIARHIDQLEQSLRGLDMSWPVALCEEFFKDVTNFVLPEGREAFVDRAMFNHEGDLLCDIVYKPRA